MQLTVKVMFDPAAFMTSTEYTERSGIQAPNLQQYIEEPEIHMLALCSSSE